MKTLASLLLAFWCVNSPGQTNSSSVAAEPNPASPAGAADPSPKAELRTPPISSNLWGGLTLDTPRLEPEYDWLKDTSALTLGHAADAPALDRTERTMLRYYERLEAGGYLTPPPPPPDNLYDRAFNAIFEPEPVRGGKATVSFTPITAIKRKNPLALLNPLVFSVSW
ncbi:MAG: hypothetical protein KJ070_26440 [Verrucomicrobia bacterium]|nr:hypothetical protein [Verrucomicrobiota bacterium]